MNSANFLLGERFFSRTPLSNLKYFFRATDNLKLQEKVKEQKIKYDFQLSETGIETYVLVIGESARRKSLGIYGYARDTTPGENTELKHMLLFTNAIAPAPNTIGALPPTLCRDLPAQKSERNYADNVLNLANQSGFKTFWFSQQGGSSINESIVTVIAKFATQTQWPTEKYDEALLPLLKQALETSGKKLIVLHLNGSHSPMRARYPAQYAHFSGGDTLDNEYDNSIYYTDFILSEIFSLLRKQKASVFYYSDHALFRDTRLGAVQYSHGHVNFPKEALDVPMWLWYSSASEKSEKTGVFSAPYCTADNFHLICDWLGIQLSGNTKKLSPLQDGWKPQEKIQIFNSYQQPRDYNSLKSEGE
jgi:glucan phosphoethanolaminetransferase (alkaline phosphatase superfamily)